MLRYENIQVINRCVYTPVNTVEVDKYNVLIIKSCTEPKPDIHCYGALFWVYF